MDRVSYIKYMKKYENKYSESAREFIKDNYEIGLASGIQMPDIVLQIYSYLNEIKEDNNVYVEILKMIKRYFGLNKDILEIGCGRFPELARRIDIEQQSLTSGSITAYDSKLVTTNLGKIKLHKELYTDQEVKYDLLLGFMACEASETIIRKANNDKKEFFLGLCGCSHMSYSFPLMNPGKIYRDYLLNLAESTLDKDATLNIEYLSEEFNNPYPILIKTYKK